MTDYLKLARDVTPPPAPADPSNPYLALVQDEQRQAQARARSLLETALKDNPDTAAERLRLSKTSGLPLRVVENNLDDVRVKEQARAVDLVKLAQQSPVLSRQLLDPTFTQTSVDDLDTLSKIENTVAAAARYVMGADGKGGLLRDIPLAATDVALGATAGVGELIFNIAGTAYDLVGWKSGAQEMRGRANASSEARQSFGLQPESDTGKAVKAGLGSAGTNLAILPIGLERGLFQTAEAAGSAVAGIMGAGVGADAYLKAREAGKTQVESALFGVPQGAFEFLFEKIPASKLFGDIAANTSFVKTLRNQLGPEVVTEQFTTLAQDFNEWMNLNPDKTVGQFIAERPDAAYQTLIATLVGVGVQTTTITAINKAVEKATDTALSFQQDMLAEQMKLVNSSMLRQRSPEQFRAYVERVIGETENAKKEVYVDAEVLSQLPQDVLAQLPASVQEALPEALAINATVAIPMADVLSVAPGTPLEEVLNDHARLTPDAMTRKEAEKAGEVLQQQAETIMQQAADQEAARQEFEAIKTDLAQQVTQAGRYSPAVADAYAAGLTHFFVAYGSRMWLGAKAFYDAYRARGFRIAGQPSTQDNTLEEGARPGTISVDAYHFSKAARPMLSTAFFGTGLKGSARDEIMSNPDTRLQRRLSFYFDKGTGIRPEPGVGGIAHRARLSNIYDANADVLGLRSGDARAFESKLIDLGYSGYADRLKGTQPGQVVLLGDQAVEPELLGPVSQIQTGEVLPALPREEAAWQTIAEGDGAQARMERMQADPAWSGYEMRIEGNQLQARKKGGVFEQRAENPVPPRVAEVADIANARTIAGTRKWPTNRGFKLALQAAVRAVTGTRDLTKDTPEVRAYLVRQLLKEAREALVTNSNAVGWYDEKVTTALEVVSAIHPELKTDEQSRFAFIWALAVTSNGVKVNKNFELAERAYTYWKANGVMPTANIGVGTAASKIHEALATYNDLIQRWGYERFKAFATTLQPNRDVLAAFGRKVSGEGMDAQVYGAGVVGPKIGNGFFMNLYGEFGQLTMDRWWVRMWGRLTGDLVVVDRQAIAESRAAFVSIVEMIKADKAATKVVEQAIKTRLGKGDPIAMAKAIVKATAKKEVRDTLATVLPATPEREAAVAGVRKIKDFISIGDELRKAAKGYYMTLDGQIEVPGGSKRRDMMRAVSQSVLAELQKDQPSLTMADFQALMWYPEKTLYDSAGAQSEESEEGYEDDEAPDYANAAIGLARQQGVSDDAINAAVERARSSIQARQRAGRSGRGTGDVPPAGSAGPGDPTFAQDGDLNGQAGNGAGRYSSGGSAPLEGAPAVAGATGPDARLVAVAEQQARGTFNPKTLELVLNPNTNLTTLWHEMGHFFLEVMADVAAQPDAPAQIATDWQTFLGWAGVTDQQWRAFSLDQKRPYHEKWARAFEQYVMEGKVPNKELQPLMRRFAAWFKATYQSIQRFLAQLPAEQRPEVNDDIRRVMDRMLATDEQIAEANEAAGLLPDEESDAEANDRLRKRSMADLKWTVRARDKVIRQLQKKAKDTRKAVEAEVRAEADAMPAFAAAEALDKATKAHEADPLSADLNTAVIADAFGFPSVDAMYRAIEQAGAKQDYIDGRTEQRMLEEHGDLMNEDAIRQAANEAVHNEARARSLATELRTQSEMLNPRDDTGKTNSKGQRVTVNALVEAAKQFAANVVGRTPLRDLKNRAWQHTAAERRAAKAWQQATAKGATADAVKAKQDQMLNHAAAKAAIDAQAEGKKILDFFARVTKGNDETVVEKGRDPDVVNAARAVLALYGVQTPASKNAAAYLETLKRNDPEMWAVIEPMVQEASANAQPMLALTVDELRGLHAQIEGMWYLAKRSRQMEVDGDLMDIEDAAEELHARMVDIGIPDTVPGETGALTKAEQRTRSLRFFGAALKRVEQWVEGMDGKYGGPFLRYVFQPIKDAADRYRKDRVVYRRKFQALVNSIAPSMRHEMIEAPELGYTFGRGHNGIGTAELLHALLHTGNDSNKRKLLLGRQWATENADGTLDTSKWDAFIARLVAEGKLTPAHFDFLQGVWDLMEETKPLAQKAHRDVFGRYFAEVTATPFVDPFGASRRGGYVPAQADPEIVPDATMRELAERENESMAYAFPATSRGFTKGRVEYNRPLKLDLRTLPQHLDKVLLFSHMEPAVRSAAKLLRNKGVSQALNRIDPSAYAGTLLPWLNRAAKQIVETPVMGDGKISRVLSVLRARAGAALMFANVSNTVQQITGLSTAAVKVKPAHLMRAAATFIAHPKATREAVWDASPYMADRASNEVSAMNGQLEAILLNPSVYERAQEWSQQHAYFLQTALDSALSPIVWTGAFNQAVEQGMDDEAAVKFADGVVRQTQGSTLPEDISRIESGPAYARMFTQFVGYFNMMANTNATAVKQIASEVGLRKGAGKALYVVLMGLLVPLWVAEAIAQGFRGGPDDEDKDGYLDDWLAAVFGLGTIKGILAQVPFIGQLGNAAIARANNNPADDKVSLSPAVSLLEGAAGAPTSVYKAIVEDGSSRKAIRDVASLVSIATGLPATVVARPAGYLADVAEGRTNPSSAVDAVRGTVTGVPAPDTRR